MDLNSTFIEDYFKKVCKKLKKNIAKLNNKSTQWI